MFKWLFLVFGRESPRCVGSCCCLATPPPSPFPLPLSPFPFCFFLIIQAVFFLTSLYTIWPVLKLELGTPSLCNSLFFIPNECFVWWMQAFVKHTQ